MDTSFNWIGLAEDGNSVELKRFQGDFSIGKEYTEAWKEKNKSFLAKAVVLDVETSGLYPDRSSIIELGVRSFLYDKRNGKLVAVGASYQSFQDPGKPLEENIIRLTGIQDKDVRGQHIDWDRVDALLRDAKYIIAHNAAFDRPFVDKKSSISSKKVWACSLSQVDWTKRNFPSRKLENLSIYHGFYVSSHRALADADATLFLLSQTNASEKESYLKELLDRVEQPMARIIARGADFSAKDRLKDRGYRWSGTMRVWHHTVSLEKAEKECKWMEENVYGGKFQGVVQELSPQDNFKTMQTV